MEQETPLAAETETVADTEEREVKRMRVEEGKGDGME
jgi:hypothetical protein